MCIRDSYTVNSRSYNETYADKNGNFERIIALSGGDCQVTTSQTTLPLFMAPFEELIRKGYEAVSYKHLATGPT